MRYPHSALYHRFFSGLLELIEQALVSLVGIESPAVWWIRIDIYRTENPIVWVAIRPLSLSSTESLSWYEPGASWGGMAMR